MNSIYRIDISHQINILLRYTIVVYQSYDSYDNKLIIMLISAIPILEMVRIEMATNSSLCLSFGNKLHGNIRSELGLAN